MFEGDEWKVMGLAAYGKPEYYDFFAKRARGKTAITISNSTSVC